MFRRRGRDAKLYHKCNAIKEGWFWERTHLIERGACGRRTKRRGMGNGGGKRVHRPIPSILKIRPDAWVNNQGADIRGGLSGRMKIHRR